MCFISSGFIRWMNNDADSVSRHSIYREMYENDDGRVYVYTHIHTVTVMKIKFSIWKLRVEKKDRRQQQ